MQYTSEFGYKLEKRPLDAGYDLRCPEDVIIPGDGIVSIDTGITIDFADNLMGIIAPRSSSSKNGLQMANTIGIIDPSYRGKGDRLIVKLCSRFGDLLVLDKDQKFAQIFFLEIPETNMELVNELPEREARGGFGSTGSY